MSADDRAGHPGISRADGLPEQLKRRQGLERAGSWGDEDPIKSPKEEPSAAVDIDLMGPTQPPAPDTSWGDDEP